MNPQRYDLDCKSALVFRKNRYTYLLLSSIEEAQRNASHSSSTVTNH